jgi:hypothetical protein
MKAIKHLVVVGVVDFWAIQIKVGDPSPIEVPKKRSLSKAACALSRGIGNLSQARWLTKRLAR